ncbi:MAG: poly-gamma-glutamate synthase PgsB [Bacteroidota bacterium]
MSIPFILLALVLLFLLVETLCLARLRRAIPVRILVLGTRGKSTVTEYIAAALRSSGRRTLAKTTGTRPTLILPDGSRRRLRRTGRARVQEQFRILIRARRMGCDALVLECMSVSPELQRLESHVLRPTLAVLTNILDDHREVYGNDATWRVKEFVSSLPARTVLISGERLHAEEVRRAAARRNTMVTVPGSPGRDLPASLSVFESNLLLALTAVERLGVSESEASAAIGALPDTLPYRELAVSEDGPALRLLNAFAVNDVESASRFLVAWKSRLSDWNRTVILFNTRSDRPLRSLQFARWCASLRDTERIILMGTHVPRTRRELHRLGVPPHNVIAWTSDQSARPLEALRPHVASGTVVVGMGNAAGDGTRLMEKAGML